MASKIQGLRHRHAADANPKKNSCFRPVWMCPFTCYLGDGKEALLADLPANQIPACYGGTLTDDDGDPSCRNKVLHSNISSVWSGGGGYIRDCRGGSMQ